MAVVQRHVMKAGDLLPSLVVTLLDGSDPVPLDAAVSITARMAPVGGGTVVELPMTKLVDTGKVEHEWVDGETDTVGDYRVDFVVEFPAGPRTFPDDDFVYVQINETAS